MLISQLNADLENYQKFWTDLTNSRSNKAFFKMLKPTAVGWKVADAAEYERLRGELHEQCDKIIETWMNGRWIAKLHLRDTKLDGGIEIIKLMQRRPGSDDALGLDHADFYCANMTKAEEVLQSEPQLKWTHEDNDVVAGYSWISIWFAGTEAKLKTGTVLDIVMAELQEMNDKITGIKL